MIPALQLTNLPTDSPLGPALSSFSSQIGDFQIVRQIGRGGMGIVYEAEQIAMQRRVALKVLPWASLADRLKVKRFQNEVRAVATLAHPNIVSIYTVGEEHGTHYFAMQLISGCSLADVISSLKQVADRNAAPHMVSIRELFRKPSSENNSARQPVFEPTETSPDVTSQANTNRSLPHNFTTSLPQCNTTFVMLPRWELKLPWHCSICA